MSSRERIENVCDRQRFAGQHGFVDLEISNMEQAKISRDAIAGFKQDHIARHYLCRRHALFAAITQNSRFRDQHFRQGVNCFLGFRLLQISDNRIEKHHSENDGGVDALDRDKS